ncbi:O-antigen ligase family protein [candidate division KSB1 bacterium]|nr:O-antigen ligase family protein [candidate division KSB1 bacterium]
MKKNINNTIHSKVAIVSFVIFLFFGFFGTSLPFQEHVTETGDFGTSNIINQIVYSFLFLFSCFALFPKIPELYFLIKKEKFLSFFLIWCLISITWSDFSFVSFKRWFRIFSVALICISFLLHVRSDYNIIKYIKLILYPYVILSLFVVLFIPGATDPMFDTWRGFASTKNHLGQMSLISILLCFIILNVKCSHKEKIFTYFILMISLILLVGSTSTTSILALLVFLSLSSLLFIDSIFKPLGIGNSFTVILISGMLLIFITIMVVAPQLISVIPNAFGKDMTFTGRIDLWDYMFREINKHLLFGAGYQSFWVMENIDLIILYEEFVWLPLQSHNGYIDIINEVGLIGFFLFVLMLVFYFINLIKLKETYLWHLLIIVILIINFQESNLFRPGIFAGTIFIFSYLTLYAKLIRPE